MNLENIKEKYKNLSVWKRVGIVFSFLSISFFSGYWDEYQNILSSITEAETTVDNLKAKLVKETEKNNQIPILEDRLKNLEETLLKNSESLPKAFAIDEILKNFSEQAQLSGVKLIEFFPQEQYTSNTSFKYVVLPIKLSAEGDFTQLLSFIDQITHLKMTYHIGSYSLSLVSSGIDNSWMKDHQLSELQKQTRMRKAIRLNFSGNILAFRLLSDGEEQTIHEANLEKEKQQKPKKEKTKKEEANEDS